MNSEGAAAVQDIEEQAQKCTTAHNAVTTLAGPPAYSFVNIIDIKFLKQNFKKGLATTCLTVFIFILVIIIIMLSARISYNCYTCVFHKAPPPPVFL